MTKGNHASVLYCYLLRRLPSKPLGARVGTVNVTISPAFWQRYGDGDDEASNLLTPGVAVFPDNRAVARLARRVSSNQPHFTAMFIISRLLGSNRDFFQGSELPSFW